MRKADRFNQTMIIGTYGLLIQRLCYRKSTDWTMRGEDALQKERLGDWSRGTKGAERRSPGALRKMTLRRARSCQSQQERLLK